MSSESPKRSLTVLDVGHGSAAVLADEGGVVVFDAGPRGTHVLRHIQTLGVQEVEAVFLSHADSDHIGGATTLFLDPNIRVRHVYLNPDPTKNSDAFRQLRYAMEEAETRARTVVEPSLTVSTRIQRRGASIEVLYPPATTALAGVGGRDDSGRRFTSNAMSAAIRVSFSPTASVLLGGDVETACLAEWKSRSISPLANALVFPHHGGLPGDVDEADAAIFAHQLTQMVQPKVVVFSIHRTRFGLPRDAVVTAILKAIQNVRFVCTQLPDRLRPAVMRDAAWSLHRNAADNGCTEGCIELRYEGGGIIARFVDLG